jgi:hypothetical protein
VSLWYFGGIRGVCGGLGWFQGVFYGIFGVLGDFRLY